MLRKSPNTEENYNFITSLMEDMQIQENRLPLSAPNLSYETNSFSLFSDNTQNINHGNLLSFGNIDKKKEMQTDYSIYGGFQSIHRFKFLRQHYFFTQPWCN